jgi:hypothetical protein
MMYDDVRMILFILIITKIAVLFVCSLALKLTIATVEISILLAHCRVLSVLWY